MVWLAAAFRGLSGAWLGPGYFARTEPRTSFDFDRLEERPFEQLLSQ